jgi:hypothetical protein
MGGTISYRPNILIRLCGNGRQLQSNGFGKRGMLNLPHGSGSTLCFKCRGKVQDEAGSQKFDGCQQRVAGVLHDIAFLDRSSVPLTCIAKTEQGTVGIYESGAIELSITGQGLVKLLALW